MCTEADGRIVTFGILTNCKASEQVDCCGSSFYQQDICVYQNQSNGYDGSSHRADHLDYRDDISLLIGLQKDSVFTKVKVINNPCNGQDHDQHPYKHSILYFLQNNRRISCYKSCAKQNKKNA
ncbi:unknown [Firmicutes bacterium CAG:534]|nr:unknown [Firmicutes bacterium CAG:534]